VDGFNLFLEMLALVDEKVPFSPYFIQISKVKLTVTQTPTPMLVSTNIVSYILTREYLIVVLP
jgi:hypothetical protein